MRALRPIASRNRNAGIALALISVSVAAWFVLTRPLSDCEVAERASQALANRNYKKYWSYMGDLTRWEFNHDRASFLEFAEVVIDPLLGQGDWEGERQLVDGEYSCTIVYGSAVGLFRITAADTNERTEVLTSPWLVARELHLASIDRDQARESDPLAVQRAVLEFYENHREVCIEHGFLVPESVLLGPENRLITIDQKIASMKDFIAEMEVKLLEREAAAR